MSYDPTKYLNVFSAVVLEVKRSGHVIVNADIGQNVTLTKRLMFSQHETHKIKFGDTIGAKVEKVTPFLWRATLVDDAERKAALYHYKVLNIGTIYDGDTIKNAAIDLGLGLTVTDLTLRLLGIDTPELRGDEREEGLKSKAELERMVKIAQSFIVQTQNDKEGSFGRLLATVWANIDGAWIDLNSHLLTNGFAVVYKA